MKTNELLGIDPLPYSLKLPGKPRPFFAVSSLAAPFVVMLLMVIFYTLSRSAGYDAWGFGLLISLIIGGAIGSMFGVVFSIISLIRSEKIWLSIVGLVINMPTFIFTGNIVAELHKL